MREEILAGRVGEGDADFPPSGEPDTGLDPRSLGSNLIQREMLND